MPYAARIQEREEAREREIKSKSGAPIDGFVSQDLMGAIKLNQSSIPALARDLRVPHDVVERLVNRLVKAGLVTIRRSKRSVYVKRVPPVVKPLGGSQAPKGGSQK
jgi:DNA-binding transcriptional ArsR family regulator